MNFIQPVTNVSRFIQRFYLVKRDNANHFTLFEDKEHFGVATLVQHHIPLHILTRIVLRFDKLRPVQRPLEPNFIFEHQLVQRRDVLFFYCPQFQRVE